MQLISDMIMIV